MWSFNFFGKLGRRSGRKMLKATIMYDKVYEITLYTGHESWAGTNAGVWIKIFGNAGHSEWKKLPDDKKYYEKGSIDKFDVTFDANYGRINKIQVGQDSDGMYADWKLEEVRVRHYNSLKTSRFVVRKWLKKQYGVSTRHIEATREEKVDCGRAPAQPRVVMGDTSAKSQWPWQAQIRKTSNEHHCGGTLIHPEWVLSASHCYFNDQSKDNYIITLGEHNRYQHERSEQTFRVKKMLIHPNYNPDKINNDLTLLRLDRPALITPDVQLACLPAPGYQLPPGEDCFVSGWGDEYVGSGTPVVLKHARLPSVSNKECYTNMKHINKVTDQMVCGGGNNRGGCFGDSGGPYVCLNQAGQFVVQGAVSWGVSDCKASEFFTVFARVGNFVNWIEENIYSKYISDF